MQPLDVVLIGASLIHYLRILPNADSLLFHKADLGFSVPLIPRLYKIHWIMWTLACLSHKIPAPLIDSTTGHYNSTGMYSTSLWLVFLTSIQQGRALECAFVVLNSMSIIATPTRNIPETSKVGTPLYLGHFRWHQWCAHHRSSTVIIFYCTFYCTFICHCDLHLHTENGGFVRLSRHASWNKHHHRLLKCCWSTLLPEWVHRLQNKNYLFWWIAQPMKAFITSLVPKPPPFVFTIIHGWWRPGSIHHMNDVRWTWGGRRGGGVQLPKQHTGPSIRALYHVFGLQTLAWWKPCLDRQETSFQV